MLAALMLMFGAASAQTTMDSKVYENVQVTVMGGGITTQHLGGQPFFWKGAENVIKGVRPVAGIEIAKYVTPVVGFGVEGFAMFNTTQSPTLVDQSNVVANVKFNMSNWFGGYKGYPRRVEVVLNPGLGWGHDYGDKEYVHDRNYLTYNAEAELNVNLGEKRAWQVTVRPAILWNNYSRANDPQGIGSDIQPKLQHMQARLMVGMTYKFGSKRTGSHNFVNCPYSVTAADYAAAKAQIAELLARKPEVVKEEVIKEVVVEKPVIIVKYSVLPLTVSFPMGSAKLSAAEKEKIAEYIDMIPENAQVDVIGSADTATGSKNRNDFLAKERANVVAKVLQDNGVEKVNIHTSLDVDDVPARSRVAIIEVVSE